MTKRYCIIGAGPAGLITGRAFNQFGINFDIIERFSDVGGIWEIKNQGSPMYESAHFISSKKISNIPNYPMPEDYPSYPNHRQILSYLKSFARDNDLYKNILFNTSVSNVEKDGGNWSVKLSNGDVRVYQGVVVCNGNTWDPLKPKYPGHFSGEERMSNSFKHAREFNNKRVLIVGGGNSACDIACDAATNAKQAYISMRRGYHFIPKFVFGMPVDEFAHKRSLPDRVARSLYRLLMKIYNGDLKKLGLQSPDHPLFASHPLMNTQLLHYLGHGDIKAKPDIKEFEGSTVKFVDGTSVDVDLVMYATGYKVTYPFLDKKHFNWLGKYPDLFLSVFHKEYDNLFVIGLHQTDGGAYGFFNLQANMIANFLIDQDRMPNRAKKFSHMKQTIVPNLSGGIQYIKSARHETYVQKKAYRKYCSKLFKSMGWKDFVVAK